MSTTDPAQLKEEWEHACRSQERYNPTDKQLGYELRHLKIQHDEGTTMLKDVDEEKAWVRSDVTFDLDKMDSDVQRQD